MRQPIILLAGGTDTAQNGLTRLVTYENYARAFCREGVTVLGLTDCAARTVADLTEMADALFVTGGVDVDPALYGEERLPQCGATDPWRDRMEEAYIGAFVRAGKPIFGICRGAQMINVALGGTLYQDISAQLGVSHNFGILHEVTSCADTFAYDLFGARFTVNSFHHQAIRKLAPSLRPAAYAEDGKIVEAFVHETLPILGVQWHPERMTGDNRMTREGPDMQRLFLHFLHLL